MRRSLTTASTASEWSADKSSICGPQVGALSGMPLFSTTCCDTLRRRLAPGSHQGHAIEKIAHLGCRRQGRSAVLRPLGRSSEIPVQPPEGPAATIEGVHTELPSCISERNLPDPRRAAFNHATTHPRVRWVPPSRVGRSIWGAHRRSRNFFRFFVA
jgi:hypothetical protein